MNKKSGSGSGLFLMEMIMVVFFFLLCASTCILLFVKSNNLSQLAKDTNQSVIKAESIAEFVKAGKFDPYLTDMSGETVSEGIYRIRMDDSWESVSNEMDSVYCAEVTMSVEGNMHKASIVILRLSDGKELYQLDTQTYRKTE